MKIESPLPTYIAYSIEYLTNIDLIDWAKEYVPNSEYFSEDSDLLEIIYINTNSPAEIEKAGEHLKCFVEKMWPGYDLGCNKAEIYARKYFRKRLKAYLHEKCMPYDLCRMISPIEQIYDFPEWLGAMYDACDWIEPNSKPTECRHLIKTVEETLHAL